MSPRFPAAAFSAPRARGITYLIAPAVALTGSLALLRAYLTLLSGAGIVLAFRPWLTLFSRRVVVPAAALLFGTLWVTGFYGSEVIPNFWVAVAGAAMTGWFVRAARSGGTAAYAGLATAVFLVGYAAPRFLLPGYARCRRCPSRRASRDCPRSSRACGGRLPGSSAPRSSSTWAPSGSRCCG